MQSVKNISLGSKPVRVRVDDGGRVYFITLYQNGTIQIRPKGARKSGSTVFLGTAATYKKSLLARAKVIKPKPITRGLVSTERTRGV